MGYVLVWAQMRFWAAVVITNLLSVIPFFGELLVCWIWGGFTVVSLTLKFFFVFHFIIPFISLLFIILHLYFLHITGRTSYCLFVRDFNKVRFFPYYWTKDLLGIIFIFFFFIWSIFFSFFLGDSEIFLECDSLKSPVHIVPEWYYLIFYAILRSIYSKSLGVFVLFFSILVFFIFCFLVNYNSLLDISNNLLIFFFLIICFFLGWLGQCHLEFPFLDLGFIFSFIYFFMFLLILLNYLFTLFLF
jgi:quinol-cytochrome oxidoreductase complex cytochrome b subunit